MELKKLDKRVLKLWYIKAAIEVLVLLSFGAFVLTILSLAEATSKVIFGVSLFAGLPLFLLCVLSLIMPALRYKMYSWGYDDKRIVVKQGVIFRQKVVIPICQIQDLHRTQGPLMIALKLSGVTISTAGSNFDISTLTTDEADRMIDELESNLEARIEELENEEI
jgi:membrane protein YdbS with pleckstrin-like domain